MSYRDLKARVVSAERKLDQHLIAAHDEKQAITQTLKRAFTPLRLVVAGLAGGAIAGWLRPLSHVGNLSSLARAVAGVPPLFVAVMPWMKTVQTVLDAAVPAAREPSGHAQD